MYRKYFINFSNHPSGNWSKEQLDEAHRWGEILDLPFPQVPAEASEKDVAEAAAQYIEKIMQLSPAAVLCQGEFTLCFAVVRELLRRRIPAVSACSVRDTEERISEDGSVVKVAKFRFSGFRRYEALHP